jgi:hypothetical protein
MGKKNEQRIWNKSELEQMDGWVENELGTWCRSNPFTGIPEDKLGKPVQWCKEQGYTVTDEMIAKMEKVCSHQYLKTMNQPYPRTCIACGEAENTIGHTISNVAQLELKHSLNVKLDAQPVVPETSLIREAVTQANDKLTERLDKGEIGVILESIVKLFMVDSLICCTTRMDLMNYQTGKHLWTVAQWKEYYKLYQNNLNKVFVITTETEPKKEQKPLEGYQKWYGHNKLKKEISILFSPNRPLHQYLDWYSETEAINLGLNV